MFKVTYGKGVELVVKRATVGDDLHAQIIREQLTANTNEDRGYWATFPRLCSQTVKARGLPFNPVGLHTATVDIILNAYRAYLELDREIARRWLAGVEKADEAVDPDLGPEPLPEGVEKNE